jgi:soluble lytic murein transglycosylase
MSQIWPWLGFCQARTANISAEGLIWQQALAHPKYWSILQAWPETNLERFFRRMLSSAAVQARLRQPSSLQLPLGVGDRLLWGWAQYQQGNARRQTLERLVRQYPKSRYAAESLWESQFRSFILAKNTLKLPALADQFLAKYANVNRSPDVRLWKAHSLRQNGHLIEAKAQYQEILRRHPISYAAYRADRWLAALSAGQHHADWQIPVMPSDGEQPDLKTLLQTRPLADLSGLQRLPASEKTALNELQRIEAWQDIEMWAQDSQPPQVSARQKTLVLALSDLGQSKTVTGLHALKDAWLSPGPSILLLERHRAQYQLLFPWLPEENALPEESTLYDEATQNQLPPVLALSLLREESYFNPLALSGSGARGLMQLMPATAQEVAHQEGLSGFTVDDLYQPDVNVRLGCRYLGDLLVRMQGHPMLAVASYNAGPGAVTRWLQTLNSASSSGDGGDADWFAEALPATETREYVRKVFGSAWSYHVLYKAPEENAKTHQ